MKRFLTASLISISALALSTSPALAGGKNERATAAIAAAQAKLDAANKVGASTEVPQLQASAGAALATAREDLSRGNKEDAIASANRAAELADQALGEAQKAKAMAATAQTQQATDAVMSAQTSAADANARAASAETAAANARTPVIIQAAAAPAAAPVTVTTETTATPATTAATPATTVKRRVVKRTTYRAPIKRKVTSVRVKTRTTVTR